MDALIDSVLHTILHSAIWRSMWHLPFNTLIIVAVVAFLLLWYRQSRKGNGGRQRGKGGYRYRSRYRK